MKVHFTRVCLSMGIVVMAAGVSAASSLDESCDGVGIVDPVDKVPDGKIALRSVPQKKKGLIAELDYGTRFTACGSIGEFTWIQLSDGRQGFASTKLLRIHRDLPAEQIVTQDMLDEQAARESAEAASSSSGWTTGQKIAVGGAAALGLCVVTGCLSGAGSPASNSTEQRPGWREVPSNQSSETMEAPSSTPPIGGDTGLYGDDHSVGSQ